MKRARLLVGIAIILVGLWVIVGEQMSGASANAVVNAPVVAVRSDVAGLLALSPRDLGSRISEGEVLASVTDELVDTVRLQDLLMERAFAKAEVARIGDELVATRSVRDELTGRSEVFRDARLREIRVRLEHARTRLAILEDGEFPSDADQSLIDGLGTLQDRLPGEPMDALVLDHAQERVRILEITLKAAEDGVFLGDGYNDSPNAQQRATELKTEIATLENILAEANARLTALDQRIERERLRVNARTGGNITAPVSGLYWETLQADGVTVQRGDPILRLVDCERTMVTLSVTERVYNDLRIGQEARFRLQGQSRVFDASIARLAGSGAAEVYDNLAVAPSAKHLERFDVLLQVPELNTDPEVVCLIGQTGRAFFDRRPLDWLRN